VVAEVSDTVGGAKVVEVIPTGSDSGKRQSLSKELHFNTLYTIYIPATFIQCWEKKKNTLLLIKILHTSSHTIENLGSPVQQRRAKRYQENGGNVLF
jgi:hypothetical protein